jgi:hypothetical protein
VARRSTGGQASASVRPLPDVIDHEGVDGATNQLGAARRLMMRNMSVRLTGSAVLVDLRVPAVYLKLAFRPFLALLELFGINKLHRFNARAGFESHLRSADLFLIISGRVYPNGFMSIR